MILYNTFNLIPRVKRSNIQIEEDYSYPEPTDFTIQIIYRSLPQQADLI